jgi:carbohydrate binding protein with CBM11 domain
MKAAMARRSRLLAALANLALIGASPTAAMAAEPARELIVADFDSGRKPNNVGGDFGCWIKDPDDPAQGCIEAFDPTNRHGAKGNALRIIYSVESSKPAFGGLWMRLQNLDATKFDRLAFRVKGDAGMGYTGTFKVELKDAMDVSSHYYVRGITDRWQDVTIALKDFEGMANPKKLKEFVIVIEDTTATAKQGVLYLDDVRFTRSAPGS